MNEDYIGSIKDTPCRSCGYFKTEVKGNPFWCGINSLPITDDVVNLIPELERLPACPDFTTKFLLETEILVAAKRRGNLQDPKIPLVRRTVASHDKKSLDESLSEVRETIHRYHSTWSRWPKFANISAGTRFRRQYLTKLLSIMIERNEVVLEGPRSQGRRNTRYGLSNTTFQG
jgi:hypothetical protein